MENVLRLVLKTYGISIFESFNSISFDELRRKANSKNHKVEFRLEPRWDKLSLYVDGKYVDSRRYVSASPFRTSSNYVGQAKFILEHLVDLWEKRKDYSITLKGQGGTCVVYVDDLHVGAGE